MELLKQRILKEGVFLQGNILKVDSFLNHQIDPQLTVAMSKELAKRFADIKIDKVLTIESSGIAIALAVALEVGTWVKKKYLQKGETVLIVDDFLADGSAALGLCNIVEQAGCKVGGIGVAIEKSFLPGAEKIKKAGYRLESLARIKSLEDEGIEFM